MDLMDLPIVREILKYSPWKSQKVCKSFNHYVTSKVEYKLFQEYHGHQPACEMQATKKLCMRNCENIVYINLLVNCVELVELDITDITFWTLVHLPSANQSSSK